MPTEIKTVDTSKTQSSTALAQALNIIGFTSGDIQKAADVLADTEVLKAASSLSAQELSRTELVSDRWTEGRGHSVPTREEIRTGPTQAASGGGVERMIGDYSKPAPQDALTMESMRLQEMLGSMRAYMRSTSDQINALAKNQEAYTTILTALAGSVSGNRGEFTATDELTQFAAQCTGKSQKFLDAARATLARATAMKSEGGELTGDAKKLRKSEIKALQTTAAQLIVKANEAALAACCGGNDTTLEIRKSISTLVESDPILKAKMEEEREKMREKDEKAGTKKSLKKSIKKMIKKAAAKAAAKSATAATVKNNQADKQDHENKNQDDASVSTKAEGLTTEQAATLQKAVDGIAMLNGTVADLMSAVSGRKVSTNASQPLTLVKSEKPDLLDHLGRVEMAINSGQLSDTDAFSARDLAGKYSAVEAGAISKSMWTSMVLKKSHVIQELFRPELTAA